jgi:prepilin peptidase CpaA
MEYLPIILLNSVLVISAATDLRSQKIPNIITLPAALAALAYHTEINGFEGFLFSVTGLAAGIALLILPYLMGGMGAGDVKLMGVVGAFIGPKQMFYAFLIITIIGGIYSLLLMVFQRSSFKGFFRDQYDSLINVVLTQKLTPGSGLKDQRRPKLCYGLAIASGTGLYTILNLTGHNPFV